MELMTRSILSLALTLTLTTLPATADDTIRAGTDIWETQGGWTELYRSEPAGRFLLRVLSPLLRPPSKGPTQNNTVVYAVLVYNDFESRPHTDYFS